MVILLPVVDGAGERAKGEEDGAWRTGNGSHIYHRVCLELTRTMRRQRRRRLVSQAQECVDIETPRLRESPEHPFPPKQWRVTHATPSPGRPVAEVGHAGTAAEARALGHFACGCIRRALPPRFRWERKQRE